MSSWVLIALTGLLLTAGLVGLPRLSRLSGLARSHRQAAVLQIQFACLLAAALLSVSLLESELVRAVALLVGLLACLPLLRDAVYGIGFLLEGRHKVGDDLQVGNLEGRIIGFGLRSLVLRTPTGTEVSLPYLRLAGDDVIRLNGADREAPCDLELKLPSELALPRALELARMCALVSPYAAPRRTAEVFCYEIGEKEVLLRLHGFVFDREHEHRYRSDVLTRVQLAVAEELATSELRRHPEPLRSSELQRG